MKIKFGVNVVGLRPEIIMVLPVINDVIRWTGQEMVITSALDGVHDERSLHKKGLAIDIRLPYRDPSKDTEVSFMIQSALGINYDVVKELDHIHIEYDKE